MTFEEQLRESEWDSIVLKVDGEVVAQFFICPTCAASILDATTLDQLTYREWHIRWHVTGSAN